MSSVPSVVSTLPVANVSPEVWLYAATHTFEEPLRRMIEATPRVYPTATGIKVYLEPDPEIPNYNFLVFEVHVPLVDIPDYVEAKHRWTEEYLRAYPPPRKQLFNLSLLPVIS